MLTCYHQGRQDGDCGSCSPKDKQFGEEMPQGEEEGAECDVVEPARGQTEMDTEALLVLCRGKVVVGHGTHK